MRGGALLMMGLVLCGCPSPSEPGAPPNGRKAVPSARADTRFVKVRNLLSEDPGSTRRATEMYPLVKPVCVDAKVRADFVATAKWSASFSQDKNRETAVLAAETLEFVATSCARTRPEAALDLLRQGEAAVPLERIRLALAQSRLLATLGRFEEAEAQALSAQKQGSVFARALLAQIRARRARETGVGYRKGMLDEALAVVSVAPAADWPLIDLTAVLSTRARLLSERAVWESSEEALATWNEAKPLYERLAKDPFIRAARERAQDVLCERAIELAKDRRDCLAASQNMGNLGALVAAKTSPRAGLHDEKRLAALKRAGNKIATLTSTHSVVLVFRGDEGELIEWALPSQRVLRKINTSGSRVFVVDRSHSDRAATLVKRMLQQGGLSKATVISARRDTLAMPCITALMSGRRTPDSCPLDKKTQSSLRKAPKLAVGLLLGRDLDAEVDDFKLYKLPAVLLSFRLSKFEKSLLAQAKSLSDTYILLGSPEGSAEAQP